MKKTVYLTVILVIGFIANAVGQDTIMLSFTARNNAQRVPLDSILIMNLSQGGDTMLYAPDTSLLIIYYPNPGINENNLSGEKSFLVSQNYPNPFSDRTFIDVCVEKRGEIAIRIVDLSGREHASYEATLDAGKHTFTFHPGNENFYLFSASYSGMTRSIKIVNPVSGNQACKITYTGFEQKAVSEKSHRDGDFPFSPGDDLRYIGYSETIYGVRGSDVIQDDPECSESYIFAITEGIPCVNTPTVLYQFKLYNTVQIGTQCWLKENLNVGTMIPGTLPQWNNGIIEKYCYSNQTNSCEIFGGFYQWDEMMMYDTTEGIQGICPPGWHIPTDEEWKQLEGEVDAQYGYPNPIWDSTDYRGSDIGSRLKSRSSWYSTGNGTDYVGFCALSTGCRKWDGTFVNQGNYTSFWSSVQTASDASWYRYMEWFEMRTARYSRMQDMGRSVRCLKDD